MVVANTIYDQHYSQSALPSASTRQCQQTLTAMAPGLVVEAHDSDQHYFNANLIYTIQCHYYVVLKLFRANII